MSVIKIPVPFKANHFEEIALAQGRTVCGVDEVGRACLAGPVLAGAAILKPRLHWTTPPPKITDSKKMTLKEREVAYAWLIKNSWYATAGVHQRDIDALNIYQATLVAMRRAVTQLYSAGTCADVILVDAMPLALSFLQESVTPDPFTSPWGHTLHFTKGEDHSMSIAAASIIAKVTRDRLMVQLDTVFPGYHLGQHKGYPTELHRSGLMAQGTSIVHRKSFLNGEKWKSVQIR